MIAIENARLLNELRTTPTLRRVWSNKQPQLTCLRLSDSLERSIFRRSSRPWPRVQSDFAQPTELSSSVSEGEFLRMAAVMLQLLRAEFAGVRLQTIPFRRAAQRVRDWAALERRTIHIPHAQAIQSLPYAGATKDCRGRPNSARQCRSSKAMTFWALLASTALRPSLSDHKLLWSERSRTKRPSRLKMSRLLDELRQSLEQQTATSESQGYQPLNF